MNSIISAAPFANLQGIQDNSVTPPVLNPETLPQHLPLIYLFAASGPNSPQLVDGTSNVSLYGADTFNLRSAFATHATVLANTVFSAGGSAFIQRVIPSDANPPATVGLYLDFVAEPALPQYVRNVDGSYQLDASGNKIQVSGTGATAPGYIGKWVLKTIVGGVLGAGTIVAGTITNSVLVQSQLYPILEFQTSFQGALGNNLGVSVWAPTTQSSAPVNASLIESAGAYIYRLQFVKRNNALSTAAVIDTLQGDTAVDFTFAPNVIDPATDQVLSYTQNVIPSYESLDAPGQVPVYGPFDQMYVYQNNLATVLGLLYAAEQPSGLLGVTADPTKAGMVNVISATDPNGVPYYNFALQGPASGGLLLAENTYQFASGGSNGTMGFAAFDTAVANELTNFGALDHARVLDDALYPFSVIYDSGFTLPTKQAMLYPLSQRKDISVILSTQDVSLAQNSGAQESSIAVALRTAANNYPESAMYGTSVCRAIVIGHSGLLINSEWTTILPLTIEFAYKAVQYMGAGNGVFKSGFGFDIAPNNQLTMFHAVNTPFKNAIARNNDWQTGLVWVQNFDRRSLFWPAVQTVYADDTSVLNSAINMFIAVELEKVCQRTWRRLTGVSNLTNNQFIAKSNQLINTATANRFDGRVIIVPNTYFTSQDKARGYSWSCNVTMYAPNMKTVGTFTVVAQRIDNYSGNTTGTVTAQAAS